MPKSFLAKRRKTRVDRMVWDLYRDGISSSLLGLWLTCREQFRLQVVEGWRNNHTPHYFMFGTMVHWVLECAYKLPKAPPPSWCSKAISKYYSMWKENTKGYMTSSLAETMEQLVGMAEIVLPAYMDRYEADWTGKGKDGTTSPRKWLATEERFDVPFTHPKLSAVIRIRGTRDGIFKDRHGDMYNFDTKCRSVIIEQDIEELLPTDVQQNLYMWAAKKSGHPVEGVVMNIIRRPSIRVGKKEVLADALNRLKKALVRKNYDHYFLRFQGNVTMAETTHWQKTWLEPILEEIAMWTAGKLPHYMNPNALITKYGRVEMFRPIVHNDFSGCHQRTGDVMDYQSEVR